MTKLERKQEYYRQIELAKEALKIKKYKVSFYHLENAHILGQKQWYRHTLSHYRMFLHGIKSNNFKEVFGQISRLIASLLFTNIWVPKGNTGGSNISPIKSIPVREELKNIFN